MTRASQWRTGILLTWLLATPTTAEPPLYPTTLSVVIIGSDGSLGVTRDIRMPEPRVGMAIDAFMEVHKVGWSTTAERYVVTLKPIRTDGLAKKFLEIMPGKWKEVISFPKKPAASLRETSRKSGTDR